MVDGFDAGAPDANDIAAAESVIRQADEAKARARKDVQDWQKRVDHGRKHMDKDRARWARDRKLAAGDPEGKDWEVDANLIGAYLEVLLSFLYAKDPDIMARVAASAGRAQIANFRMIAETLQIVVSRLLKDANLKKKAKRWVRSAETVGIGWLRATMQTRRENDPLTVASINDLKANITQATAARATAADPECTDQHDRALADYAAQMTALEAKLELVIGTGIVLDVMKPEDIVVAPECSEVEEYWDAPWIGIDLYKGKQDARAILVEWGTEEEIDLLLKSATVYMNKPRDGEGFADYGDGGPEYTQISGDGDAETETIEGFYRFTEIYSKRDGIVRTYIQGVTDRWARAQYAPHTWKGFYPLFAVMFNPVDGLRYPQSDVSRMRSLQTEYSRTRSSQAEHRKRAIPGIIFDASKVEEESVKKLQDATRQEYVGIKMIDSAQPVQTVFAPKVYNQVDPSLYDTTAIQRDLEKISGVQEAMASSVSVEKTATEAKIQDSGFGARTGARRDNLEDGLTDLANCIAQLAFQLLDQAEVVKYAGPDAVWMQMTPDEALTLFSIEVKAGSTGKPKANSDRDAWGVLMPMFTQMQQQVAQFRMQGPQNEWLVQPLKALMNETLKRMDDPADVELFMPEPPPPVPTIDPMTGQVVMQQPGMPPPNGAGGPAGDPNALPLPAQPPGVVDPAAAAAMPM